MCVWATFTQNPSTAAPCCRAEPKPPLLFLSLYLCFTSENNILSLIHCSVLARATLLPSLSLARSSQLYMAIPRLEAACEQIVRGGRSVCGINRRRVQNDSANMQIHTLKLGPASPPLAPSLAPSSASDCVSTRTDELFCSLPEPTNIQRERSSRPLMDAGPVVEQQPVQLAGVARVQWSGGAGPNGGVLGRWNITPAAR